MAKRPHQKRGVSRREFLKTGLVGSAALLVSSACSFATPSDAETSFSLPGRPTSSPTPTQMLLRPTRAPTPTQTLPTPTRARTKVSIVRIDATIAEAVYKAIELLGGFEGVLEDKHTIMLKPNLVADFAHCTTNPEVVFALAQFMQDIGKKVCIGEGSAVASGFNLVGGGSCVTNNPKTLDDMQDYVFKALGYADMAEELDIPLINLNSGPMTEVMVPNYLAYEVLTIHESLTEIDLLCSVPMMKTHYMATVSLGMKNLIGLYPASVYGTVRSRVHQHAWDLGSEGVAFEIVDMVGANKLGLTVIDASTSMEGQGPSQGDLLQTNLIIAGTNPLATDMVAAAVMGFDISQIPQFYWANAANMEPQDLSGIDVRGLTIEDAWDEPFVPAELHTWPDESWMYDPCPDLTPFPTP
jgi:uncharacterized protein (DUF362 family)